MRPSESISGFMSEMVMVEEGEWFICVQWSRSRNAMSPVPPAMSSIFQPEGGLDGEGKEEEEEEGGVKPGFMERTKWSLGSGLVSV